MNLTHAKNMALQLMEYHGVRDYKFAFLRKVKKFDCAGRCNYKLKIIWLQPTFVELNHPFIVKQTILHEIAHALKPKHKHNKFWKVQAREIGYVGKRCYGKEVKKI